ncbi:MAG: 50S ribosomal protein L2 [Candidatus Pacearchaeota archaeon]|nr:MAG: 50S ribosomal protein L2 [Candidatus Pacearchaeota archaeon]
MGKRIIQQARGHGSLTYRVRKKAFRYTIGYPSKIYGEGVVLKILNSPGHTAPLAEIKYPGGIFYIPAFKGMFEGQKINFDSKEVKEGNILELKDIPIKTQVYNIESKPKDGGVFIRTSGSSGVVSKIVGDKVYVLMPSKKEKAFNKNCRATIGVIAGSGRLEKPIVKAGKMFHIKKAKNKLWPRTSAVKMNVIDHPFGSGRGKNIKSKIAKRNAPPGRKVGHLRPRRTGHVK